MGAFERTGCFFLKLNPSEDDVLVCPQGHALPYVIPLGTHSHTGAAAMPPPPSPEVIPNKSIEENMEDSIDDVDDNDDGGDLVAEQVEKDPVELFVTLLAELLSPWNPDVTADDVLTWIQ